MSGDKTKNKVLSRSDILGIADDIQTEMVDVPEWGGSVLVRGLTGAERDRFEAGIVGEKKSDKKLNYHNFRARLVVMSVVDEEGKRLFTHADVEALGQRAAASLAKIYDKAQELSGLSDDDVEELTGNSPSGDPSAASTSA